MRFVCPAVVAITVFGLLLPLAGTCSVPDEIVLWGGENDKPPVNAAAYDPDMVEIEFDGALFFRIRTSAVGYSVAERETIVLKRIVEIMSSGKISPVYVDQVRSAPTVYVGKYRLISVYPQDAEAAGAATPRILAEKWADGVAKGLLATAPSNCFGGPPTYIVAIGGRVFFRLVNPYVYGHVRARGEEVDRRLAAIVSEFDAKLAATVPVRDGGVSITYDGRTIVTATPADAQARGMKSVQALADAWLKNLCELMPIVSQGIGRPAPTAGAAAG